ncbi:MAG TPA: hypothetical protein VF719_03030, partial [Abditibacteriaceae bacterium]
MPNISPLAIRIQASGSAQVRGELKRVEGAFDAAVTSARAANAEMKQSAAAAVALGRSAREARVLGQSIGEAGREARSTGGQIQKLAGGARDVRRLSHAFKETTRNVNESAGAGHKLWEIYQALRGAKPLSLFNAAIPDELRRKIGLGLVAKGAAEGAITAGFVKTAATKQTRVKAIEGITGSRQASEDIYNQTDRAAGESFFNLPDLVVASKTLAKDRQFSVRALQAADDLAAAGIDEGTTPQDVARALGRLRAGDTGEAFERFRDFGIGRPDLEAQGLKFDSGGALEDKSKEGVQRAIDAVIRIIEERFGGLSKRMATETLEGSLSNLQDNWTRFTSSIGEVLIPAITLGANALQILTGWLARMPQPVKAIIAYVMAFDAVLMVVAGSLVLVSVPVLKMIFTLKILRVALMVANYALGFFGTSVRTLSMSILTRMVPALAAGTLSIGMLALTMLA